MFMEMLRQLTSQEWACGMHSRRDCKPKELRTSRPRPSRLRRAEASFILAEDIDVAICRAADSAVLDFHTRNAQDDTGFVEDADFIANRRISSPTSADLDHAGDAAYMKELRGIHNKLQDEVRHDARRQHKADAARKLYRSSALKSFAAARRQQSDLSGCSSLQSGCSVPDLDRSAILGERYDETMEHVRSLEHVHKRMLRADCPLTLRQQKAEREEEQRQKKQQIRDYRQNMHQKLQGIGSVDHADVQVQRNASFAHTVRDGVQEYFKQAANIDVYYPSPGETRAHMTNVQRKAVERSIQILETNRT